MLTDEVSFSLVCFLRLPYPGGGNRPPNGTDSDLEYSNVSPGPNAVGNIWYNVTKVYSFLYILTQNSGVSYLQGQLIL